jgi:hypothetical protein
MNALPVAAADEAESVVFDFVGPARAGRNRAAHHGQAGLDEVGMEHLRLIPPAGVPRESLARLVRPVSATNH